ncbi:MAG: TonB family protein [Burkholderiales bacterium]|jgi:protein TonB|nr:TonB family protein [Burkholderiales bacterium]
MSFAHPAPLRATLWLGIAATHIGVLMVIAAQKEQTLSAVWTPLEVRMIEAVQPVAPPVVVPPIKKPKAMPPQKPIEKPPSPVIATSPADAMPPAPEAFTVPAVEPPIERRSENEVPVLLDSPKFDADYLDNPAPDYPTLSKRLGEQGRVVLRVFVDAFGRAGKIEIKQTSGYARLDESARLAVIRWRFVPAREEVDGKSRDVGAWVLVPITFHMAQKR